MKRRALSVVLPFFALVLACGVDLSEAGGEPTGSVEQAITDGQPDAVHTAVGAMYAGTSVATARQVCTTTLLSSTVALTAGHCNAITQSYGWNAWVTFDQKLSASPSLIPVTMHLPSDYHATSMQTETDVGILVLQQPVRRIAPARLPTADLLGQLRAAGELPKGTPMTVVGYGVAKVGPGQTFEPNDQRLSATVTLNTLGKEILHISENAAFENGGTCYGDSGGPLFHEAGGVEYLAGTLIGGDGACTNLSYFNRTDTAYKRAFIGQFVPVP